jgi:hypothetical protein
VHFQPEIHNLSKRSGSHHHALTGGRGSRAGTHAGADQGAGAGAEAGGATEDRATASADRTAREGAAAGGVTATREAYQHKRGKSRDCEIAKHVTNSSKREPLISFHAPGFQPLFARHRGALHLRRVTAF